ncbi:hypothetical protein [Kitasatospora sp. NPDC057223]
MAGLLDDEQGLAERLAPDGQQESARLLTVLLQDLTARSGR